MKRRLGCVFLLIFSMIFWVVRCSPSYSDMSSANGQLAIIQQANDDLTAGDCGSAISILAPLINSQYVTNAALIVYASAFACKGGVNFPNMIGNLQNTTSGDIWSQLIKANYSTGAGDGRVAALDTAVTELCQASTPAGNLMGSQRTADANTFMVFIELNQIALVISPLGNASATTGQKANSISGLGTVSDMCHVQVAIAQLSDSLEYVSTSAAITNVVSNINAECATLPGGTCPTNHDYTACLNSVAFQAQGQLLINAIDSTWQ